MGGQMEQVERWEWVERSEQMERCEWMNRWTGEQMDRQDRQTAMKRWTDGMGRQT